MRGAVFCFIIISILTLFSFKEENSFYNYQRSAISKISNFKRQCIYQSETIDYQGNYNSKNNTFQDTTNRICLNQCGFYPKAKKIAVVIGNTTATEFFLTPLNQSDTVFSGLLSSERASHNSNSITKIADFSAFRRKGKFVLHVPGIDSSYPFLISDNIFGPVSKATLKGFYFQRSSEPLSDIYAGLWQRPAGHADTEVYIHESAATTQRPDGTKISTPGGWYDAGDYNKYIVNSGITMGTLLSAYEDFPNYYQRLTTNIPESGDDVPDIINEAVYNLRWMLTMQDPFDGGVYHKCTNAAFDGMVMPGVTKAKRFVVQKSTAATLDFAAVTAQAARVVKKFQQTYPGLADSCLQAAEKAWNWAKKNPEVYYNQEALNKQFAPPITTGAYGDRNVTDEWFWAASELLITTKKQSYFTTLAETMKDSLQVPSWGNVASLGKYSLLRYQKNLPSFAHSIVPNLKQQLINTADHLLQSVASNAFVTVMGGFKSDFVWGSNAVAANQGILLVNAYLATNNKKYLDGALSNMDYLLGRNATGYCFVTGIGTKSPMHPHHRVSVADGIVPPVPGLLVGGPNPGRQDGCAYIFTEPETAYVDSDCAYASNEIAINWNAPIVYLSGAIEVLQKRLSKE